MHTVSKYISPKQIEIIVFMLENKIITFKTQQIFRNNFSFKQYMKNLHDKNLVLVRRENGGCNEYTLSDKGEYLARFLNDIAR